MLARLKRRIPDAGDDALLSDLLGEAASFLRAYLRRSEIPADLEDAQLRVAVILYNRMGMEGEVSHNEGGISRTAEALPEDLKAWLNAWRMAKTAN